MSTQAVFLVASLLNLVHLSTGGDVALSVFVANSSTLDTAAGVRSAIDETLQLAIVDGATVSRNELFDTMVRERTFY